MIRKAFIFLMVFVGLANAALRRLRPWLALNRAELIIVYVMLTVGTSISGHDMLQVLLPIMTVGYWFATPQNRWEQMLDGTSLYDRKHMRDPQKLKLLCGVADEAAGAALAGLKETPNSDREKEVKKLQDKIKTTLKIG